MAGTAVQKDVISRSVQRVTLTSAQPLKVTLEVLHDELNIDKAGPRVFSLLETATSKEEIEKGMGAITEGTRDFVYVHLFHGSVRTDR